jgi:hypothetical protein
MPDPQNTENSNLHSKEEFIQAVRTKYPKYNDQPDDVVLTDYLAKHPDYYNTIDWQGEKKKGVQDPYGSPDGSGNSASESAGGSSDSDKYLNINPNDLLPPVIKMAKTLQTRDIQVTEWSLMGDGTNFDENRVDLKSLVKDGQLTWTNAKGEPCAEAGLRNIGFTWGTKWEIANDLKGYPSHADGGIDLTISSNGVSFKNTKGKDIHCKDGLLLPSPDKDPKKKQKEEKPSRSDREFQNWADNSNVDIYQQDLNKKMLFVEPGLFEEDKTAFVDSVFNTNSHLEWVQRLYDQNAPSIPTPKDVAEKDGQTSTHLMSDDGNGYVFPRLVMKDGKLMDLGDDAEDYARATNTGIQLPKEQGSWFAANGYKQGTDVLKAYE